MISFIPRVGKVKTGQTSGGFTVIIPLIFMDSFLKSHFFSYIFLTFLEYKYTLTHFLHTVLYKLFPNIY